LIPRVWENKDNTPNQEKLSKFERYSLLRKDTGSATASCFAATCSIPDVYIDERRLPLLIARATLRYLIAGLEVRATGDPAR
jgi:hypothetical protein